MIVLGDFNSKRERENIYGPNIVKFSLHHQPDENGIRLIDFASQGNLVICSTKFQHRDIHKDTWLLPDRYTRNQIDHFVIKLKKNL